MTTQEQAEKLAQLERERDDKLAFIRDLVELWDNDGDRGFPLYDQGKRILASHHRSVDKAICNLNSKLKGKG